MLNLAFARMRCTDMLPGTLPQFAHLHPNVKINLFEGTSDENDRRLLDGQVDVAFYSHPATENPLIAYETIDKEELLICTAKNHPIGRFAQENPDGWPSLDPALLEKETVILMYPEQRTRQMIDALVFRKV